MREVTENVIKREPKNIVYFSPAIKYTNATAQHLRYEGFLKAVENSKYSVVTDIANQCGYSDPQYFSKIFKTKIKQLPREYIQSINV